MLLIVCIEHFAPADLGQHFCICKAIKKGKELFKSVRDLFSISIMDGKTLLSFFPCLKVLILCRWKSEHVNLTVLCNKIRKIVFRQQFIFNNKISFTF